jgi:hypothetical protein
LLHNIIQGTKLQDKKTVKDAGIIDKTIFILMQNTFIEPSVNDYEAYNLLHENDTDAQVSVNTILLTF